jgi:peptidoglycan-N-acetylglucosamine deacetylase
MRNKPLASISLDLDNQWSYLKTHGDKEWENYPSYFDIFVPYILEILRELDIKITFFIVGRDACNVNNKIYLKQIVDEGHDIGNHSFNHEVWINQYSQSQIESELEKTENAIFEATGRIPNGFRSPGFSWNEKILKVLYDRHYIYDASTLPTFIGPLARMYYFRRSDFSKDEKKQRSGLFGSFYEGLRKIRPYYYNLGSGRRLLEIPVTTLPILRLPFHMSYLIYISLISSSMMKSYLYLAIFLCRITKTPISFLLHPLDIIGGDKIKELAFFPGMNIRSETKIKLFKEVINILKEYYTLVDMNHYVVRINNHSFK